MLYFPPDEIDQAWEKVQSLLYTGRLTGIWAAKVSTARKNPRATGDDFATILYTSTSDEEEVMRIGRNLLSCMEYRKEKNDVWWKNYV